MFTTKFGPFDGGTWEALCQQVFKRKYQADGYQAMPASPGDYGLEGFTLKTGWGFQCYCPNKHYERKELYEKQRDKITEDLGKLKAYKEEIQKRLGTTKISQWIFVTPEFDKNDLLVHARTKEIEVRSWQLPFLTEDFTVLLHDGENYLVEINEIRSAAGQTLIIEDAPPVLAELTGEPETYEQNVHRKSQARLSEKRSSQNFEAKVQQLAQRTLESFLESDGFFRRIADAAPVTYVRLVRLINEYENYVADVSMTWAGTAEELTTQVREGLERRISNELSPELDETHASKVARHMVARWLAICELDYD